MRLLNCANVWVPMWIWCAEGLAVMIGLEKDFYFRELDMAVVASLKMCRH